MLSIIDNGKLFSWGKCHFGQLGHGHQDVDCYLPNEVQAFKDTKVTMVACGESFTMATVGCEVGKLDSCYRKWRYV